MLHRLRLAVFACVPLVACGAPEGRAPGRAAEVPAEGPRTVDVQAAPTPAPSASTGDARPRGSTLEMSRDHVRASGGVPTLVGRTNKPISFAGAGQPPLPIFLNRDGGTYYPGVENSRDNTSIVPNWTSTVGGFGGTDEEWAEIVACVEQQFARFNVAVVTTEPTEGDYIETVIGGHPWQVQLGRGTGGVAPVDRYDCYIIPNAIVYVFSEVYGNDPRSICETAAQEIGHALSLDHEYHCPDPMSYLGDCGEKSFRDYNAQCGEYSPRACSCERPSQNSVQILYEKLGASGGGTPPTPAQDPIPPVASILAPRDGASFASDSVIRVVATAVDDVGLASTELVWTYNGEVYPCPFEGFGGAVVCTREGDTSIWDISVGTGARTFYLRARDTAGNITETPPRSVSLGDLSTSEPDDVAPSVEMLFPEDGVTLRADTPVVVRARVSDAGGLAAVDLAWLGGRNHFPCPFSGTEASCRVEDDTYEWAIAADAGTRSFAVRAVDLFGNMTKTPERTVVLSADPNTPPSVGPDLVAEENDRAEDAFPTRCGNAIDLVVAPGDEDWFSYEAPEGVTVELALISALSSKIALELRGPDGAVVLARASDIAAAGGVLEAISPGPRVLARVTATEAAAGYRLSASCLGSGSPPKVVEPDSLDDLTSAAGGAARDLEDGASCRATHEGTRGSRALSGWLALLGLWLSGRRGRSHGGAR